MFHVHAVMRRIWFRKRYWFDFFRFAVAVALAFLGTIKPNRTASLRRWALETCYAVWTNPFFWNYFSRHFKNSIEINFTPMTVRSFVKSIEFYANMFFLIRCGCCRAAAAVALCIGSTWFPCAFRHIYKYHHDTCYTFLSITWFFSCRYINLNAIYSSVNGLIWCSSNFLKFESNFEMICWWWLWEKTA